MIPRLQNRLKRSNTSRKPKIAFIANTYNPNTHADKIGTKLFLGMPMDKEIVSPRVDIASIWIDQIGPKDIGTRIARMNDTRMYSTIADALTLGGDELAVDGIIYIGEHGDYSRSRLGVKMYPRMNFLEQIFRVFDASDRSVPVYSDKYLAYSWLDSKWIYDRSKELNVPMMAGSSLPYCWRDPMLEHPIGTEITEAVAIGAGGLDASGIHVLEMLQCMVERRSGGETGVVSVQGLQGDAVWKAIDTDKISSELVESACGAVQEKVKGPMRELVKEPRALLIHYNDGMKGAILMLDEYINSAWAYAAKAGGKTVATEFVLSPSPRLAHFSYLALNIQQFITSSIPPAPIERNLLTNGILDMGIRSIVLQEGEVKQTPFLNIEYIVKQGDTIWPESPRPNGQSIGPWPPNGYEFIFDE